MKTAIESSLIIYGLAAVISAVVAVMIKLIYWGVRFTQRKTRSK